MGRQVYESDGSETFPETKTELELLTVNRQKAERRLQEARDEKTARERAEKKEKEETILICPACGAANPKGTKFCQECGIRQPVTATKRFCTDCGTEIAEGNRFCGACGVKVSE
ncbi:zinc-ribbon domain-containing protein [Sanguibacteroides justesenii]|nr:zinc-ribbon domain-containing protein [Sanguibacteroides justesenii]